MKIGHLPSGFRCRVSGFRMALTFSLLTPDTRHLKPMLREGFTTPDNVQKKDLFFNHVTRSERNMLELLNKFYVLNDHIDHVDQPTANKM